MNKEEMSEYGRLESIPVKNLKINPLYQRKINKAHLKSIINNFDWRKVDVIKVSYRDGEYFVYDGQHTVAAIQTLYPNASVKCLVREDMTWEEEAYLFVSQDVNVCKVSSADKFRANYNRGDEDTKAIVDVCKEYGINIMADSVYRATFKTAAVNTLTKYYQKLGKDLFTESVELVSLVWAGSSDSLTRKMLTAVFLFVKNYHGEYKKANAVRKWKAMPIAEIISTGDNSVNKGEAKYAKVLLDLYNKGSTVADRLIDKF